MILRQRENTLVIIDCSILGLHLGPLFVVANVKEDTFHNVLLFLIG
jgi:hypothetical protein